MPHLSRRQFLTTSGGAVAASVLGGATAPESTLANGTPRSNKRLALVGTGIRGITMWGRRVAQEYSDQVTFVGLSDHNPGRLAFGKEYMGVDCPTFTDCETMLRETKPDMLAVMTMDSTHHTYIVMGLDHGCDIITEKPMTTRADYCQEILDAQARSGKKVTVTFNYRYAPHRQQLKELLMQERIGTVTSVDFHWYLDVFHGADYFRRWHGQERYGGTLFVHKATHHFDLLNWWLNSEPEVVYADGALEYYGYNNAFRHTHCRPCPHKGTCKHHWDITRNDLYMQLYVANEHHDGYLRDGCVWSEDIDIYDKMAAQIRYANGVQVSYSCTTYSPYEGYRIAFNGTEGRLEAWIKERQPWEAENYDEIRVTDNFGATEVIQVPHGTSGHGGGDARLRDRVFKAPNAPDPYQQAAGARDGAMSILIGIAARESVKQRRPIHIAELTTLKPRAVRPGAS